MTPSGPLTGGMPSGLAAMEAQQAEMARVLNICEKIMNYFNFITYSLILKRWPMPSPDASLCKKEYEEKKNYGRRRKETMRGFAK